MERLPESFRPSALSELLALELEILANSGVTLDANEYRRRFPEHADIMAAALQSPVHSPSLDSTKRAQNDTQNFAASPPRSSSPAEEEIPERLGRFEVRGLLVEGAFGRVYLAHDTQLDRLVALKAPSQKLFDSGVSVETFIDEARNAARLKHSGLVAVYDVQQDGELPYIVQESMRSGQAVALPFRLRSRT